MEAKLIRDNDNHGVELRLASRKADTWPGYDDSFPLGKAGYWIGSHRDHQYLGRTFGDLPAQLEEMYGFEEL